MSFLSNNPLVSVIVVTYNRIDFLAKTIDSIVSQSYSNLEILIVADGKDYRLADLIKSFGDERLRLIEIDHSGRPSVPRNVGIRQANGDLIAFCDDDDLFDKRKIQEQVDCFLQNGKLQLCYTSFKTIDEKGNFLNNEDRNVSQTTFKNQLLRNTITFSSVLIKKDLPKDLLFFNESLFLKASEDFLFVTKIVEKLPIFFLNKPLLFYRVHQQGISQIPTLKKQILYFLRLCYCMGYFYKQNTYSVFVLFGLIFYHLKVTAKQILYSLYLKITSLRREKNG